MRNPITATWLAAAALCASPASAQVVNGSFESSPDPLEGWTIGPGARVEVLTAADVGPGSITPPDGARFALLSSGPGAGPGPGGDLDGNGRTDYDRSQLSATFTTTVDDERLSFRWAFLTDELGPGTQGAAAYDDLFDVTIDGVSVIRGSVRKPGGSSPYVDSVAYDGQRYTVSSSGATDGSDFGSNGGGGRTPFHEACIAIADPGSYTLAFEVADQADTLFDSALAVDAVEIGSACDPTRQITSSTETLVEVKGGAFVFSAVTNGRPSTDAGATTFAFRSNGNYSGDNPGLQEQIWLARRNGAALDVTRITAATGREFGNPSVSSGGRNIVFASDADFAPPGNADGNFEIVRYDRAAGVFTQITNTAGCTNDHPTINENATRIAFVSDCDFGFGSGDTEIVLWDGAFHGVDTPGCTNHDPQISRDVAGRYVTFLTDCDAGYPGLANGDGNLEVLQWDTASGNYLQITDSPAGIVHEGISSSADGTFVSLASNADHEPGANASGAFVAFRYDRSTGTFLQLVPPDPLRFHGVTSIDDSGSFIAIERIDLATAAIEVVLADAAQPGVVFPVATGDASVTSTLPVVAVAANRPLVAFQSDGNFSGDNGDANTEIWIAGATYDRPTIGLYCNMPNLPVADACDEGVSDVISTLDAGTLVDLDVFVRIDHSFVGDLRVELEHLDSGTRARIVDRPGHPPGAGCAGDDIDAVLDDAAILPVEDACAFGPTAVEGSLVPDQDLGRFDGETLAGDWRLTVSDRASSNTGTLVEWCLIPATE